MSETHNLYELHVTLGGDITTREFTNACCTVGVKPVVLDLHAKSGVIPDAMTSSRVKGNIGDLAKHVEWVTGSFKALGYLIKRVKVETTLDHPAAAVHSEHQYYECHFPLILPDQRSVDLAISSINNIDNLHLSRNTLARPGMENIYMATLRAFRTTGEKFTEAAIQIRDRLLLDGVDCGNPHLELVLSDTNLSHDQQWTSK